MTTKAKKQSAPAKGTSTSTTKAKADTQAPPRKAGAAKNHLARLRKICLAYPESSEVIAWGHPTFRVRGKIFASTGDGTTVGVKLTFEQQADLVANDPRFQIADYVGKHGWVTMSLAGDVDFALVESLIAESFRLVAPKTLTTRKAAAPAKKRPAARSAGAAKKKVAAPKRAKATPSKKATTAASPRKPKR